MSTDWALPRTTTRAAGPGHRTLAECSSARYTPRILITNIKIKKNKKNQGDISRDISGCGHKVMGPAGKNCRRASRLDKMRIIWIEALKKNVFFSSSQTAFVSSKIESASSGLDSISEGTSDPASASFPGGEMSSALTFSPVCFSI